MKPLQTEPTETDFKSKVIELIEKRMSSIENDRSSTCARLEELKDLKNQIKNLC
jgi:hypothetical protein